MNESLERWTEKIAELEHQQWQDWRTRMQAEFIDTHNIALSKWLLLDYKDLPEMVKEEDRVYARKVIKVIADDVEKMKEELWKRILVICRHCKTVRTLWDTIDECSYGGTGMCDCNYESGNRVYYPYEDLTVDDVKKLVGEGEK